MKTKKMSLSAISGALSRSEMKKIMAGSGDSCLGVSCKTNSDCGDPCTRCKALATGGMACQ